MSPHLKIVNDLINVGIAIGELNDHQERMTIRELRAAIRNSPKTADMIANIINLANEVDWQ